ncbi:membrane protein [Pontibacillus halophilus JSM 076056 = DSM 19796]|uniref:Riboflavin transporter n=1 Tax=Pontibacillus halophilus JSM 076056 = DSM 19796 TaxID=1385510 RepID=A0A0A5GL91_9BACI|nr:ECF transporter S component [Pontibacillus halophilus]KGX94006.1 membrane protein [Pontibacillus halophilus JSM 076056 = DSM 19796]
MSLLQKRITVGILAALSIILFYWKIPLPFFPSVLTLDLSDLPSLVGAIILGPVAGILIQLLKNIVDFLTHGSYVGLPINQIANFLSGSIMVGMVGVFYHYKQRLNWQSILVSISVFLAAMYALNYYFILPSIMNLLGLNLEQYIVTFSSVNPYATTFSKAVLLVIVPFNLIKVLIVYGVGLPFAMRLQRVTKLNEKRSFAA